MTAPVRIGIVTISDRASRGVYGDKGGPAIRDCLTEILSCPWEAVPRLIPDERPGIEQTLIELCDREQCCLVVTTGGTGPAARDVTPEATEAVCDKMMPGFGELMRQVSLKFVPTAILPAQTPEQKQATVKFLQELQVADGGFVPAAVDGRLDQNPKGGLRATSAALRALKYFGGAPNDKKAATQFVEKCWDAKAGCFAD